MISKNPYNNGIKCKLIVLDNIFGENGMTEFKQIIGRGTRLKPEYGKMYFTILDFRNASRLFADPTFDGDPVQIYEPKENEDIVPPIDVEEDIINQDENSDNDIENGFVDGGEDGGGEGKPKFYRVNDVPVRVISERVQYYDSDGKLITESLTDYSKNNILQQFSTLNSFLNAWNGEERKQAIIEELRVRGVLLEALKEGAGSKDLDDFDLICHIAYDKKPLTKVERANNVKKKGYLYKYSDMAQEVLEALLEKYKDEGISELEDTKVLELKDFGRFGSPLKIIKLFGGKEGYINAIKELEKELYIA